MTLSPMLLSLPLLVTAAQPPSADIMAEGPKGPLKGTITGEAGSGQPVILIIPGSGPTDRDGNGPLGLKAAPYRLLAEDLAQRGIVTVRIDKRGMFASASAVADANAITITDYVHDTEAWIAAIRHQTGTSCVWVLGHSEGGLVALATAAQSTEHICGLVLVATAGRTLGEILKEQLRANPANTSLLDAAEHAIDKLAAGRRVDASTLPAALAGLFRPEIQGFLISEIALDPAALISKVRKPILILQGERDIQVSVTDAQILKQANSSALLKLLPDTNHVLKRVISDDRSTNIATYADPNLPLASGIGDTIARLVKVAKLP